MRRTISGSPLYYSPEIVQETAYDEKIDIWAIGMMTYECLIGKIPFRIYSELDLNRIVSQVLSRYPTTSSSPSTWTSPRRPGTSSWAS
jgi:serine/threonine protein kinase